MVWRGGEGGRRQGGGFCDICFAAIFYKAVMWKAVRVRPAKKKVISTNLTLRLFLFRGSALCSLTGVWWLKKPPQSWEGNRGVYQVYPAS